MKIYLKFDHTKNSTLESVNSEFSIDQVNDKIKKVIHKWNDDDNAERSSHLSEIIHNELDYEIILLLATKNIEEILKNMMIKNFLDEHL